MTAALTPARPSGLLRSHRDRSASVTIRASGWPCEASASLYESVIMRTPLASPIACAPQSTRGQQRRRRLTRAVARWGQVLRLDGHRVSRVAELGFTTESRDPLAAQGQMRRFWTAVRRAFGHQRYFCWMELQRDGTPHYHALWLNPPPRWRRDLVAWVTHTWGLGRTRTRFHDRAWFDRRGTNYVLGYAKKMGQKAYQQEYDEAPRQLRTTMNQRLGYELAALDHARDRWDARYVPERTLPGQASEPAHLLLIGTLVHRQLDICRPVRRPGRGRPRAGPKSVPCAAQYPVAPGTVRFGLTGSDSLKEATKEKTPELKGGGLSRRTGADTTRRPGGTTRPARTA